MSEVQSENDGMLDQDVFQALKFRENALNLVFELLDNATNIKRRRKVILKLIFDWELMHHWSFSIHSYAIYLSKLFASAI